MKNPGAVVVSYAAIADNFSFHWPSIEQPGYQLANLSCISLFITAVRVCNKISGSDNSIQGELYPH